MSTDGTVWRDRSNYCQSDKERVPNCFEARFGCFKLVVHRHIHYPKDQWLASCYPELFQREELASKDLAEAQCQAVAMLQAKLENAVRALHKLINKKET